MPNDKSSPLNTGEFPAIRMRRNRSDDWIRKLTRENTVTTADLIWPVFVIEGEGKTEDIDAMPNVRRYTVDKLAEKAKEAYDLGIQAIAVFPVVDDAKKDVEGSEAVQENNLVCRAIRGIKAAVPHIGVIADVALDPYTSHGHDGVLRDGKIQNDQTLDILCKQSLIQAEAGVDIIAPSDMMDGRITSIRTSLEKNNFQDVKIMSYAAKYASCFYGPFRSALQTGQCLKGDKKTYQMDPANSDEAMREIALDVQEGADIVMIKPGMPYLDIIRRTKDTFRMPTAAYHVSGEYAMLRLAAEAGQIDYKASLMESLHCFKRAGADMILTYGAFDAARILQNV